MKTSVLKKPARSLDQPRTQSTEDYWTEAAFDLSNCTQNARLIAHSQNLRAPLMAMGSMLDLMELRQRLACVRPLYEEPSDFDEVAFRRVRKNFQCLVNFFNELADLIGQSPLQLEGSPPPRTDTNFATFINDDWRGLDDAEAE
jgi:hypothetical protein